MLGESVTLLQGSDFELIDSLSNLVELALQALVGAHVDLCLQQDVHSPIKTLFGAFKVSGSILLLALLILLLGLLDDSIDGIQYWLLVGCGRRSRLSLRILGLSD